MKPLLAGVSACLLAAYPLIIFFGLQKLPLHYLGLGLLGLACLRLLSLPGDGVGGLWQYALAVALALLAAYSLLAGDPRWFRFYPVAVNTVLLLAFGASLWRGPPVAERLARLSDPDLPAAAVTYTRRVTAMWCVFFLANGAVALYTALYASLASWAWYNGLVAYLLMGALFGAEWLVRRQVRRGIDARAG